VCGRKAAEEAEARARAEEEAQEEAKRWSVSGRPLLVFGICVHIMHFACRSVQPVNLAV